MATHPNATHLTNASDCAKIGRLTSLVDESNASEAEGMPDNSESADLRMLVKSIRPHGEEGGKEQAQEKSVSLRENLTYTQVITRSIIGNMLKNQTESCGKAQRPTTFQLTLVMALTSSELVHK